jgi:hypothetical protein
MNADNEELVINQQIAYCFPSRKNPLSCAMNAIQYNKVATGGNDPKVSQKMKFSNYVKHFSKSRGIQEDVCTSIALHPSDINPNNTRIPKQCSNPIFSKNWRPKTGAQLCFCAATNSIIGDGVPINGP